MKEFFNIVERFNHNQLTCLYKSDCLNTNAPTDNLETQALVSYDFDVNGLIEYSELYDLICEYIKLVDRLECIVKYAELKYGTNLEEGSQIKTHSIGAETGFTCKNECDISYVTIPRITPFDISEFSKLSKDIKECYQLLLLPSDNPY